MNTTGARKTEKPDFSKSVFSTVNNCGEYSFVRFTTTRHGGVSTGEYASFNLGEYCGDDPADVRCNRVILCNELDVSPDLLLVPRQVHEDKIVHVNAVFLSESKAVQMERMQGVDALVSSLDDVCLGVTTADCVPVVLYCPNPSVIASIHAGWRGTAKRIVNKVISEMQSVYVCNPEDIRAVIFPCISSRVYEVGEDVVQAMAETGVDMQGALRPSSRSGYFYLDLVAVNRQLLLASGVKEEHIEIKWDCTYTREDDLFSARRQGLKSGRALSGIVKKKRNL